MIINGIVKLNKHHKTDFFFLFVATKLYALNFAFLRKYNKEMIKCTKFYSDKNHASPFVF